MDCNIVSKNFILKKYDESLIDFDIVKNDLDDYKVLINSIADNTLDLPEGVKDDRSLLGWLKNRTIPKNRAFVYQILKNQNIEINDLIELLNISKGLSLNDVYWVVDKDFEGTFKEYNLYENDFSDILSLVAYTGEYNKQTDSPISPEWTTSGNLPKCWRRENGKLYLYKAGTSKDILGNREGYEPFSEYYISGILDYLNIEHVKYDLKMFKNKIASVCECFCSLNYSLVPMSSIITSGNYSDLKKFIIENNFENDFGNMILIDALTYNYDRHYNNFGVIKNNITNEYVRLAPIYDNGLGLFSNLSDYSINNEEMFEDVKKANNVSNWNIYHSKLLADNITSNTYSMLIKMKNYKIKKHDKYNLPDKRIELLNKTINNRANDLLNVISEKVIDSINEISNESDAVITGGDETDHKHSV